MFAAQGVDVDAPRAKRQKVTVAGQGSTNGTTAGDATGTSGEGEDGKQTEDAAQVKEKGLKLWQTIKDAKDKECVTSLWLFRMQQADYSRLRHPFFLTFSTSTTSRFLGCCR